MTWAHPEFGQVLATCSFDRQAAVWEESFGDVGREGVKSNWIKKSILVDSRTAVTDVKFAPKHLGLQLVSTQYFLSLFLSLLMLSLTHFHLLSLAHLREFLYRSLY